MIGTKIADSAQSAIFVPVMTILDARRKLFQDLQKIYDQREADSIAELVMEKITGLRKIDRILEKNRTLPEHNIQLLKQFTADLLKHTPVQYVLHEAWFYGLKFFVNENVLIPRPETEELVRWVVDDLKSTEERSNRILDIGTGSGCIAISIKKQLPGSNIDACDISAGALQIAQKNALDLGAEINLIELNFLDRAHTHLLPNYDCIVSNPPYVPLKDKATMRDNIINFEPHLALFVDDNDPLIFYRAMANFAFDKLSTGGKIYVELHENLADATANVFHEKKFSSVEIRKDMQGKSRMLKISKHS